MATERVLYTRDDLPLWQISWERGSDELLLCFLGGSGSVTEIAIGDVSVDDRVAELWDGLAIGQAAARNNGLL